MLTQAAKEYLAENYPEILLADGLEQAFIGVVQQFNKHMACYDRQACVKVFMDRDGMSLEEAQEYFDFNVVGAWVGENTPVFLDRLELELE